VRDWGARVYAILTAQPGIHQARPVQMGPIAINRVLSGGVGKEFHAVRLREPDWWWDAQVLSRERTGPPGGPADRQ
jgi:hypothetical protein